MQNWKTRSRKTILDYSKFLVVESHTVELPNGHIIEDWPWIVTPNYTIVIAVTEDEKFLCFRQTKYGVDGITLAPIGGYIELDEEPLKAAQRELFEETGYRAADWMNMGQYRVDGNRGAGMAHLFLARKATYVQAANADDLEEQKLLLLSRSEVETALKAGQFKVLPWTTAVALALHII